MQESNLGLLRVRHLRVLLMAVGFLGLAAAPYPGLLDRPMAVEHECRFWALIGSEYPDSLLRAHLLDGAYENLKHLGAFNTDGWGIGYFLGDMDSAGFLLPILRRGGPSAYDSNEVEYDMTVAEMNAVKPFCAIAHVRAASSGITDVPDPHPFLHGGTLFAHNGTISKQVLFDLLGDYPESHPPDYGTRTGREIDSELYHLYLLEAIEENPGRPAEEAIVSAVADLAERTSGRLNFVMSAGDTLYALRYDKWDSGDPLRYFPAGGYVPTGKSDYWVVASQPVGDTNEGWAAIPPMSLAVFVPGEAPRFVPIGQEPPEFGFGEVAVEGVRDSDGDGYFSSIEVAARPVVSSGSYAGSLEVMARPVGFGWGQWVSVGGLGELVIASGEGTLYRLPLDVQPDSLEPVSWELRLDLYADIGGIDSLVATAEAGSFPGSGLDSVAVEGAYWDSSSAPPEPQMGLGIWPSVGAGPFEVTWGDSTADPVVVEVFDSEGRLVWRATFPGTDGKGRWHGCDQAGRPVDPGIYHWRIQGLGRRVSGRVAVAP